ncbi:MAG: FtsX-like permease family protein [Chthoniobacterales bacterium]
MATRRTPLAWRNLTHDKVTLFVSSGAVAFAVLIMFMEVGFLNGLYDSQTGILQAMRADFVMVSRSLHILNTHETFPLVRLEQARALPGVKAVYPIYLEDLASDLRNPAKGDQNGIRVLAFEPASPVWQNRALRDVSAHLRPPQTIAFDRKSRPFFGELRAGMKTELADRAVIVADTFSLGPDYYYDGNVLTSIDTFFTLFPFRRRADVFAGVIQLEKGASSAAFQRAVAQLSAPEVDIFSKADLITREQKTWQKATPAGYVFTMGVAVGFIIGVFICYQILYTDIADHLPQLATLKALGYQNHDLRRLVLQQAVLLGLLGFLPALLLTFGLYEILTFLTGIVTRLTVGRVALVFALTITMCFVSGFLAVRKALTADPAELF